jgi:hypothetical protein
MLSLIDRLKTTFRLGALLGAALLTTHAAFAQFPGGASPAGLNAALTRLFGDVKAFTARAEVRVLDKAQQETMSAPMNFALLDNKIRVEIDMTQMKGREMPPGAAAGLKQMGMSQVISLVRPDKSSLYIIYPDQKACLVMPLAESEAGASQAAPKLKKTPLGKETIDGHPCEKNKVVLTTEKGQPLEAITWNAPDLKNFPIQIQTSEKDTSSVMRFKDVQFVRPAASQFEVPAGYDQYQDVQQMMQGFLKKMMGGNEGK